MTDQQGMSAAEITVDTDNLHREEVFTDLHAASIRRLTPVKADGGTDSGRDPVRFDIPFDFELLVRAHSVS